MLRKPAPFLIIAVSFLVVILLCLPLSAKEEKPKPKSWEISGIVAALQDERSGVGDLAVDELPEYDKKALKSSATAEQIQTLSKIFENKKVDVAQRVNAASALTKMGYGAKVDAKGLVNILKDKETKDSVRGKAAETLGNLGNEAKP
jgi:HEAT repeat protein